MWNKCGTEEKKRRRAGRDKLEWVPGQAGRFMGCSRILKTVVTDTYESVTVYATIKPFCLSVFPFSFRVVAGA